LEGSLASALKHFSNDLQVEIATGDLLLLNNHWYVTHTGLLRVAKRKRCSGINVEAVAVLCDPRARRYVCKATVYKSKGSSGFVGYGDADPSNVPPIVRGAEMRVAETRAVNRALRKAYGIGICSVEELARIASSKPSEVRDRTSNDWNSGPSVRDQLVQVIRSHELDASLVKAYAKEYCGVQELRLATREQVENFIRHLSSGAENDRNALLCQLNSYRVPTWRTKEGAA
jgi:hypothetical protein